MLPGSVQSPERPDAADPVLTLQLREAEAAGAPRSPLLRGPPPTSPTSPAGPPRPPGLSDEDAAAWAWFCALDQDGSGGLDRDEMWPLVKKVGLNISRRQFERKFGELDPSATGAVSFNAFNVWWRGMRETERREMRRQVKDVFDAVDTDQSGRLSKAEFAKLVSRAKKHLRLVPPFDLDKDWRLCKTIRYGDNEEELTYPAFERWWKERLGVDDADIPVLPEHMVMMADEQSELARKLNKDPVSIASSPRRQRRGQRRTGKVLWGILRPRVLSIVRMQRQWGQLHEIYESNQESRFMLTPVPKYIKDPDSSFSGFWDIAQVILLLYVSIIVPLRAGFQIATPLWTFAFFFDAFVDVYFIVDLGLNFRTAYYRRDGTREDRPRKIAENYLSGWFSVDFFSCVPVSYVEYFLDTAPLLLDDSGSGAVHGAAVRDAAGGSGSNFKGMKMLRLVRLSKMLRLARLKKILAKYGGDVNLQTYVSVGFTLFTIFFLVHLLTCFYYMVGSSGETLANGVELKGWVQKMEDSDEPEQGEWLAPELVGGGGGGEQVPVLTRYAASMHHVLDALEHSTTSAERWFSIVAEFVRDFILGMVAGLMTTISMAMNGGEQEAQWRLRALKGWMQTKNIPKGFQIRMSEYCNELWSGKGFDTDTLFSEVPPAMKLHLTSFLYGGTVANIPLFRGLSEEVIGAICNRARPMYVMPEQEVMQEGQPGQEMYMIISGELEVLKGKPPTTKRLGFLSDGSFFGEAAVLASARREEMRTRTVRAVTDSELCFLTHDDILTLNAKYPELKARLARFEKVGQMRLTAKNQVKLFGKASGALMRSYSQDFRDVREVVQQHRSRAGLTPRASLAQQSERSQLDRTVSAEPEPGGDGQQSRGQQVLGGDDGVLEEEEEASSFPSMTEIRAALKLKKMATNARARVLMQRKDRLAPLEGAMTRSSTDAEKAVAAASNPVVAADESGGAPATATQAAISALNDKVERLESKLETKLDTLLWHLQKLGSGASSSGPSS